MPPRAGMEAYYGRLWREVHRPPILARARVPIADVRSLLVQLAGALPEERVRLVEQALASDDRELLERCECRGECGAEHKPERCPEATRLPALTFNGRVYIQVAHLDQDPRNNAAVNLRALCQACHNRVDAHPRAESRRITRSYALALLEASGPQVPMFPGLSLRLCTHPSDVRVQPPPVCLPRGRDAKRGREG